MNKRLQFEGVLEEVQGLQAASKGFRQVVILKELSEHDSKYDQYYTIQIYSNTQTDTRFKSPGDRNKKVKCLCYFKGQRWMRDGGTGWQYNNKLELIEWVG